MVLIGFARLSGLQQDITRGRDMVDSLYQGGSGLGSGTHNPIMSSEVRANTPPCLTERLDVLEERLRCQAHPSRLPLF